jgi:hypothetical protein
MFELFACSPLPCSFGSPFGFCPFHVSRPASVTKRERYAPTAFGYNSFWIEWGQFHGDGCAFKSIAVSMYKNDVFSYRRHNLLFSNSCLQSSLQSYDDGTTLVLSVPISHSPPFIMYYCCSFTPNKMPVDQQLPEGEVVSRLSLACQSQKNTYPAPPARRIHRPTPTIMVSCYNFAVSFAISFHFLTPI